MTSIDTQIADIQKQLLLDASAQIIETNDALIWDDKVQKARQIAISLMTVDQKVRRNRTLQNRLMELEEAFLYGAD